MFYNRKSRRWRLLSWEEEIARLKQQVQWLTVQIQQLQQMEHFSIYEYMIDDINIEKVKGTLQIGSFLNQR
jgi:hypothetical protein